MFKYDEFIKGLPSKELLESNCVVETWKDVYYYYSRLTKARKADLSLNSMVDRLPSYEVSNLGRIRHKLTKRIRKTSLNKSGYEMFFTTINNKGYGYLVHRIVASSFNINLINSFAALGKPMEVNHIDFNKTNNYLNNLEWVTKIDNMSHAVIGKRFRQWEIPEGKALRRIEGNLVLIDTI